MISIDRLVPADRAGWEILFAGYNEFYGSMPGPELYERVWAAFDEDIRMHAPGAKVDGRLKTNAVARRLQDKVAVNRGFILDSDHAVRLRSVRVP